MESDFDFSLRRPNTTLHEFAVRALPALPGSSFASAAVVVAAACADAPQIEEHFAFDVAFVVVAAVAAFAGAVLDLAAAARPKTSFVEHSTFDQTRFASSSTCV